LEIRSPTSAKRELANGTSEYFSKIQTDSSSLAWFAYPWELGIGIRKMSSFGTDFVEEQRYKIANAVRMRRPTGNIETVTIREKEGKPTKEPRPMFHDTTTTPEYSDLHKPD
jgi:hypothetical protein